MILKMIVATIALVCAQLSFAAPADLTISFTAPTVEADQRPIVSYTLFDQCDTSPVPFFEGITETSTTFPAGVDTANDYVFCVAAIDVDGRVGEFSNLQYLSMLELRGPGAPGSFQIQVQCANCAVNISSTP